MTNDDDSKPGDASHGGPRVAPQTVGDPPMTETTTRDAAIGAAVLELIAATLAYTMELDRLELEARAAVRARGYRIVTHVNDHDAGTWQVLDDETREVLESGAGDMDDAWHTDWWHADSIFEIEDWPDGEWPDSAAVLSDGVQTALMGWARDEPDNARAFLEGTTQ